MMQDILRTPATAAIFLVMTVRHGAEDATRDVLAESMDLRRATSFRSPNDRLSLVVGVGARLWDRMYAVPRPAGLHPFEPITGDKHMAVATPGDLLFHIRANRMDLCFELARHLGERLAEHAEIVDEVHGFRYFDQRDLLGFVDGTENPEGEDAVDAVRIGPEDPDFVGGSYVIVQKYVHDLDAWGATSVEEQERVIGRHKLSDIELDDDEQPTNSHVALNTIEDEDGNEREIVRDNMPFGSVAAGEYGTYFIGYAADPDVIEQMLRNMFLGDPPGNYDRILDFSTAVTGGLFFVPPLTFLEELPEPETISTPADVEEDQAPQIASSSGAEADEDGSLRIGTLRRSTP